MFIDKLKLFSFATINNNANQDLINDQINKYLKDSIQKVDIRVKKQRIWINYNPEKFLNLTEDNLKGLTFEELLETTKEIQKLLDDISSICNITIEKSVEDFQISRIDLTQNIFTDYTFSEYIRMFENIKPNRKLSFIRVKAHEGHMEVKDYSTIYFRSKERTGRQNSFTITIYDKKEHFRAMKIPLDKEYENKNIMRFELSFNNSTTVNRKLNIKTLRDLTDDLNFTKLNERREEILNYYLFYEDESVSDLLNNLETERRYV